MKVHILTLFLFYCDLSLFCRNQGISSSLPTSVTVMSTQCCRPKNYMEHLQIMVSVSRYQNFLEMPKLYKRSRSGVLIPSMLNSFLFPFNSFLQSTKCSSARDLKLLCADDEQTRTCWITAMRLLKVGLLITNW